MTIVLDQRDKMILSLAQDLLRYVGCPATEPGSHDENGVAECWCPGRCKEPLPTELRKLIAELQDKGWVPNYVADAAEREREE